MITERTLRKWRKEALEKKDHFDTRREDSLTSAGAIGMSERILRLTQELLDQHLLRRKS